MFTYSPAFFWIIWSKHKCFHSFAVSEVGASGGGSGSWYREGAAGVCVVWCSTVLLPIESGYQRTTGVEISSRPLEREREREGGGRREKERQTDRDRGRQRGTERQRQTQR